MKYGDASRAMVNVYRAHRGGPETADPSLEWKVGAYLQTIDPAALVVLAGLVADDYLFTDAEHRQDFVDWALWLRDPEGDIKTA